MSKKDFNVYHQLLRMAYDEAKNLKLSLLQEPSKSELILDYQPGGWDDYYLRTHLRRFERCFYHLSVQNHLIDQEIKIVDIGSYMMYHRQLKKIFPKSTLNFTDGKFNAETDRLDIPNDSVDLVLLWEVVEHFYVDPFFAFSEINRVLKPNGLIFLSTPNLVSWDAILRSLFGDSPLNWTKYKKSETADHRRHAYEHTPYSISCILDNAGFSGTVWTENTYHSDYGHLAMRYFEEVGISVVDRGDTIFAIAAKTGGLKNRFPDFLYD